MAEDQEPIGEDVILEPHGTLSAWHEGIGDDKKYHIVHVSKKGVVLLLKMKDEELWKKIVRAAKRTPEKASIGLRKMEQAKPKFFPPDAISKATFSGGLGQLYIFDQAGKKTKIPSPAKEQAMVFYAINQYLGGEERTEDADAWSVMKGYLFILTVAGVLGGLWIDFTTMCDPDYVATGRRRGMSQLINWIGYQIGPIWSSVILGIFIAFVLGLMIYQLIKRPTRFVLEY
ncbi:MAG: hypothetical protein KDA65_08765 [Planctomycetaceae bacterium]|nr:hypothetical protein [Planctomycetaceae bacterium]